MAGGLKTRGIEGVSGHIANVNQSGQVAVEATVNVGAVSAGISGQTLYMAASNVSGEFPNVYVTTSGQAISGIPHKLVVGFSGEIVIAKVSGESIFTLISGQPVKISGETVNIQGGVSVSGNVVISQVSGQPVNVTSGQVQVTSGVVVSKVSGESLVVTSGQVVAKVSGETVSVGGTVTVAGGVTTSVSGNTVSFASGAGVRVSGEVVNISGFPVSVSGGVAKVSGEVHRISEESGRATAELKAYDFSGQSWRSVGIDVSGGSSLKIAGSFTANVSGQPVNVSGSTVYLVSGQNPVQLYAFDASGQVLRDLWVKESGSHVLRVDTVTTVDISGATISAGISGQTLYIVSGQNTVQLTSGYNIVKISGETILAKTSGDAHVITSGTVTISGQNINVTSGQVQITSGILIAKISGEVVNISGNVLNISGSIIKISGEVVQVSGQVVSVSGGVVRISGESIRMSTESGRATSELKAYDYSGQTWNTLGVDVSGGSSLKIAGSFTANVSGQPVNVSGSFVFISGQPVNVSGSFVFISGQPVSASGGVAKISGEVVQISGQVVSISGGVAKVSGETVRLSFLEVSGTFVNPYVTQSGKGISGIPHRLIVALSGDPVTISGNVVQTTISGNVVNISGNVVSTSGGVVRVSGEAVKVSGQTVIAEISGQTVISVNVFSGNTAVASHTTIEGEAMLTIEPTKTLFVAYQTLMITAASGGTALLSGDSRVLSVRNIGQSGTVMFVGSSGTSRAPWVATAFSGWGWQLKDGDSITIPVFNPAVVRVVSLTSGQPVSYAINNY